MRKQTADGQAVEAYPKVPTMPETHEGRKGMNAYEVYLQTVKCINGDPAHKACKSTDVHIENVVTAAQEREAKLQAEIGAFVRAVAEEMVLAGYRGGDRTVQLENIRKMKADNARLTEIWKSAEDANIRAAGRMAGFRDENANLRELVERLNKALDESREHSAKLRDVVERLVSSHDGCEHTTKDCSSFYCCPSHMTATEEAKAILAESADALGIGK